MMQSIDNVTEVFGASAADPFQARQKLQTDQHGLLRGAVWLCIISEMRKLLQ